MHRDSLIYVAGHRGLVGSAIVRKLQTEGFGSLVTRTRSELDLTDQAAVRSFFARERPEFVFLAAAKVGGILANSTYPADFINENILVQTNVIDAAYRHGTRKLLFLGSSCIYPRQAPQPVSEECLLGGPLEPTNEPYAVAKIAGIKMCQAYRRQYGFRAICLMPTNLYGPGDNFDLETSHVLPALLRKCHLAACAARGQWSLIVEDEKRYGPIPHVFRAHLSAVCAAGKGRGHGEMAPSEALASEEAVVSVWGSGRPLREFLHVDDLADACLFLMRRYDGEGIVNVGTGKDLTVQQLARTAAEVVGFKGKIEYDREKPDGTPRKLLDVSRLHGLGWSHRISLREGMVKTYQWYTGGSSRR